MTATSLPTASAIYSYNTIRDAPARNISVAAVCRRACVLTGSPLSHNDAGLLSSLHEWYPDSTNNWTYDAALDLFKNAVFHNNEDWRDEGIFGSIFPRQFGGGSLHYLPGLSKRGIDFSFGYGDSYYGRGR